MHVTKDFPASYKLHNHKAFTIISGDTIFDKEREGGNTPVYDYWLNACDSNISPHSRMWNTAPPQHDISSVTELAETVMVSVPMAMATLCSLSVYRPGWSRFQRFLIPTHTHTHTIFYHILVTDTTSYAQYNIIIHIKMILLGIEFPALPTCYTGIRI